MVLTNRQQQSRFKQKSISITWHRDISKGRERKKSIRCAALIAPPFLSHLDPYALCARQHCVPKYRLIFPNPQDSGRNEVVAVTVVHIGLQGNFAVEAFSISGNTHS